MNDETKKDDWDSVVSSESGTDKSARARNRTVMLSPDVTDQVRARLQENLQGAQESLEPTEGRSDPYAMPGQGQQDMSWQPEPSAESQAPHAMPGQVSQGSVPDPVPIHQPEQVQVTPSTQHEGFGASTGSRVVWAKPGVILGFLVSYDEDSNGAVFPLQVGRLIVSSEIPGGGSYLFVQDSTVSPMHAIIRISADGEMQILDQLSEFGTRIWRADTGEELELSGDKSVLRHGDMVSFGDRSFCVCVVNRPVTA